MIENCIRYDTEGWKVDSFVKDPNERRIIMQTLRQNFVYLSQLFASVSGRDNFPFLSQTDVSDIFSEADLFDKTFNIGIADTKFITTKTNVKKKGYKLDG